MVSLLIWYIRVGPDYSRNLQKRWKEEKKSTKQSKINFHFCVNFPLISKKTLINFSCHVFFFLLNWLMSANLRQFTYVKLKVILFTQSRHSKIKLRRSSLRRSVNLTNHEMVYYFVHFEVFTSSNRAINRISTRQRNIWRRAISGILTRLGWLDPPMGRDDQPK